MNNKKRPKQKPQNWNIICKYVHKYHFNNKEKFWSII